jgi:hypothetical protein
VWRWCWPTSAWQFGDHYTSWQPGCMQQVSWDRFTAGMAVLGLLWASCPVELGASKAAVELPALMRGQHACATVTACMCSGCLQAAQVSQGPACLLFQK